MKPRKWKMWAVIDRAGSLHSVESSVSQAKLVAGFGAFTVIPVEVRELPKRRRKA